LGLFTRNDPIVCVAQPKLEAFLNVSYDQGCQMVYSRTKKSQFGYILEDLGMVHIGIFYGR
jgi:hypothetical protein